MGEPLSQTHLPCFQMRKINHCSVTLLSCVCIGDGLLYARSVLAFSLSPEDIQPFQITLSEIPAKFVKNLSKADSQLGT